MIFVFSRAIVPCIINSDGSSVEAKHPQFSHDQVSTVFRFLLLIFLPAVKDEIFVEFCLKIGVVF